FLSRPSPSRRQSGMIYVGQLSGGERLGRLYLVLRFHDDDSRQLQHSGPYRRGGLVADRQAAERQSELLRRQENRNERRRRHRREAFRIPGLFDWRRGGRSRLSKSRRPADRQELAGGYGAALENRRAGRADGARRIANIQGSAGRLHRS